MTKADLELAEFSDPNGDLGRTVPSGKVLVPGEVWRDGDFIRWRRGVTARTQEVSPSMLAQFIRLEEPESVTRFAKRWGVLCLSTDKVPRPGRPHLTEGIEPIEAWLYFARRARALLGVAAALKLEKLGDVTDWDEFARLLENDAAPEIRKWVEAGTERHRFGLGFGVVASRASLKERLRSARSYIATEIDMWLDCWKVQRTSGLSDLGLIWNEVQQRWDLQINYHGLLFPAIALQLALVVADADSLYSCSGCGAPYIRPRERKRPKPGCGNYCDKCTKGGVAQRKAAESYREKKAQALRMHLSGVSVPEIAETLHTKASRVRSWLPKPSQNAQAKTRK